MKYFAYRDTNGHIHVKHAGDRNMAWEEAMDSDLVDEITNVYEADSRTLAEEIAKQKLRNVNLDKSR